MRSSCSVECGRLVARETMPVDGVYVVVLVRKVYDEAGMRVISAQVMECSFCVYAKMDGAFVKRDVVLLCMAMCLGGQERIMRVDEGCEGCSAVFCIALRALLLGDAYKGDVQVAIHSSLPAMDFNFVFSSSVSFH